MSVLDSQLKVSIKDLDLVIRVSRKKASGHYLLCPLILTLGECLPSRTCGGIHPVTETGLAGVGRITGRGNPLLIT
jgi:hypothetical protein